jgi:serine/threonine protein phosphatase PrpC
MPISTGYTISMCVAAMLITLMMPTQSDAERRKPSGTTTTTIKQKCNRNYTACVGDCYLTHGTQGPEARQCTSDCDHVYNRCMGSLIR